MICDVTRRASGLISKSDPRVTVAHERLYREVTEEDSRRALMT